MLTLTTELFRSVIRRCIPPLALAALSSFNATNQMARPNLLRDLDIDGLAEVIPTYTEVGRAALLERLSDPITDGIELDKRQAQIKSIKSRCKPATLATIRTELRETEEDVRSTANAADDTRHAEYYTQILWPPESRFAWLNEIGWLNELIVFFRTLFLPGLSVILPLFVFVAPLIFYNLVLKEPLTVQGYFNMLQTSIKKAMPSVLGKARFAGSGGILEVGEQFVHVGISIAMFGASIWNQVSSAFAMRAVVADIRRRADAVKRFAAATVSLGEALGVSVESSVCDWILRREEGQLGLFGGAWNTPARLTTLLDTAGKLDMLAAVAMAKRTCFPTLCTGERLQVTDLYHPGLSAKARIYNSLTMDGTDKNRRHVLLTGPNRGGKSTLLKSLGCAVLMAQTVGIVFARSATIPVFDHIITALSPQDVIGKLSLFEAEIEFAKEVKSRLGEGTMFLMMDEIFHGTNAHDGVEASQVFLDDLYATKAPVFSVVSTHYMDLPGRYGATSSQNLCMEASVDPSDPDRLIYSYRLCEGVNRFSSVREILRERGLLAPCVKRPEKTTEEASKV